MGAGKGKRFQGSAGRPLPPKPLKAARGAGFLGAGGGACNALGRLDPIRPDQGGRDLMRQADSPPYTSLKPFLSAAARGANAPTPVCTAQGKVAGRRLQSRSAPPGTLLSLRKRAPAQHTYYPLVCKRKLKLHWIHTLNMNAEAISM